jgi:hypothetical protein
MRHQRIRTPRWLLIAAGVAFAAAGCGTTVTHPESLGKVSIPKPPTIDAATRRGIDRTLDRFVRDAVERRDPLGARAVASPMMRSGMTQADWANGSLPVAPFQAKGRHFHGYTVVSATPSQVYLTMILQAKHPKDVGAIDYNVRLTRIKGAWLVDWMSPTAFFAPSSKRPALFAEPDLAPSAGANFLQPKSHGTLIFEGVMAVLLLPAAVVAGYLLLNVVRERRRSGIPDTDERWAAAMRPPKD